MPSVFLTFVFWLALVVPSLCLANLCENPGEISPSMYKLYCAESEGGSKAVKPAGASSSFSDSFNMNAASLPTKDTPYGVEVLGTGFGLDRKPGYTFALLKGFSRFGTGLSTGNSNTFYSNDLIQRLGHPSNRTTVEPYETARGELVNLNLGTSFLLFDFANGPSIQLGVSARYNNTTNTIGGGPAILIGTGYFGFGFGMSEEGYSNQYDRTRFYSAQASVRLLDFELEVTSLFERSQPTLKPITITTINHGLGDFFFTAAMRSINYLSEGDIVQYHGAVQYILNSHLAMGYLYNYIPGGHSIGLQVYL